MFRHVSKVASVLKYRQLMISNTERPVRSKCFYRGLLDLEIGIDALIEDEWEESRKIFKELQNPFHSFGRCVLVYFQAVLSFEYPKEDPLFEHTLALLVSSPQQDLLTAHTTLMFASLQFLKPNWSDHLKAAYEIKKAYRMYEQIFQDTLGISIYHYDPLKEKSSQDPLEHGVCFGLGLFYLALSFLPSKVVKILGHFKCRSVQALGLQLLKRVSESKTLYASVSSLSLLYYYAHRSIYVSPDPVQYQWILSTLRQLQKGPSPLISLLEIKLTKQVDSLQSCIARLESLKRVESRLGEHGPIQTIREQVAFKSSVLVELGWLLIYSERYLDAVEVFFCLESTCPLSRLFYHYVAICCLVSAGCVEKASREVSQLGFLLEHKTPSGLSSSEIYAEHRILGWQKASREENVPVERVLRREYALWELVYLWHGLPYLSPEQRQALQLQLEADQRRPPPEADQGPLARLLLGLLYREQDAPLALAYFDSVVRQDQGWLSCAMYEIALTYALKGNRQKALDHLKQAKNYAQEPQWKMCIETRCRFLSESLN